MHRLLSYRSAQIVLLLLLYLLLAPYLPISTHTLLYTVSLAIKDLLLWMLPLTVTFFIAHAISSFEKKAPLFLLSLFAFEALSNSLSVWYAYLSAHSVEGLVTMVKPEGLEESLTPLFRLSHYKPSFWSADKGTFMGLILGLIAAFKGSYTSRIISYGKKTMEGILTKVFAPLIPLFILGFVARMYQSNLLSTLFVTYSGLILWLLLFLVCYILLLFFIGAKGSIPKFLSHLKNLLPATGMAFSSGCSLSTMPWTIQGTAKNLKDPELAKAVIPASTNIQQIGDCIANCFLCFLIYQQFYGHAPDLFTWLSFSTIFVLARFATAAVLGGAIFIMLPIYESYLSFTPEMIAIILAFNVLLDPIITSANVIANGALCTLFERVLSLFIKKPITSE